ncbi:nucleotidyl transferase AbiEii/AbiGii toxin family protein [bacterium]|nr:nucleotidyl transferase AbiEii/AbiGii toxin family protein [candidate division CSSED10-310 bacterium]
MIPRKHLAAWRKVAPWQHDHQVEQDLIISRCLVEIFSDELLASRLAFRGGTALHKLYLQPPSRYSEDIDLVHRTSTGIGDIFDRLRERLTFLGKPRTSRSGMINTVAFRFESEIAPVVPMRLKIEINCREPFSLFGYKEIQFTVESAWFTGGAQLVTYSLEELLGTKMRALFQRKKARDLFDLHIGLQRDPIDPDSIVTAFRRYMGPDHPISGKQYLKNLELKIEDAEFLGDIAALLRPDVKFEPGVAFENVRKTLVDRL